MHGLAWPTNRGYVARANVCGNFKKTQRIQ